MNNATRPTVPEVVPLALDYLATPGNDNGGSLHIALIDGNLEDVHLAFCRGRAIERGDGEGLMLAELLLRLSMTQRRKVYHRVSGG